MLGGSADNYIIILYIHLGLHSGSGIEAALAQEVGTRFAIENPRAKDFWGGAIGAATDTPTEKGNRT